MKKIIMITAIAAILTSCNNYRQVAYLQDMDIETQYQFPQRGQTKVQINDLLAITVNCRMSELAVPFNTPTGTVQVTDDGTLAPEHGGGKPCYRVTQNGTINFPMLGELKVRDMSLLQVEDMIRQQIIDGQYIKDPNVTVELLNFKYAVLGAVGKPGIYTVDGDRITLLEAIARSGDVTSKARINRVSVVREENGTRTRYSLDLRSREIYKSPCYFLRQNDLVYVEPRYLKHDGESKTLQYLTLVLSITSAVSTVIWATK